MFNATKCGENQTILEWTSICVCNKLSSKYDRFSLIMQLFMTVYQRTAVHIQPLANNELHVFP